MRIQISAVLLVIIISSAIVSAKQTSGFDVSSLSEDGRRAQNILLRAPIFSIGPVGYSAQTSECELALHALLNEKEAVTALKDLLANATAEGKMYALYGLYVKDKEAYEQEVERYKDRQENGRTIKVQSGCIIMPELEGSVITKIESGLYDLIFKAGPIRR